MAGILLSDVLPTMPLWPLWLVAAVALAGLALAVLLKRRWGVVPLFLLLLSAFLLRTQMQSQQWAGSLPLGLQHLQVQLLDSPRANNYGYKCTARVQQVASDKGWQSVHSKVVLRLPDSVATTLCRGDQLDLVAKVAPPRPMKEGETFNYPAYLRKKNIYYVVYLPQRSKASILRSVPSPAHHVLGLQRRWCDHLDALALESQSAALAQALLLGSRDHLSVETQARFRIAGVAHVLSLSGLHVGLFAALLLFVTRPLSRRKWSRWAVLAIQLSALLFYLLLTGDAPATRRATLMFALLLIGRQSYAPPSTTNTLAASALILLFVDPSLIWDVGFQLSYAAMLAITLIYQPLWALLQCRFQGLSAQKGDPLPQRFVAFMMNTAVFTTVIQMATLPLTLYHFHCFPTYFLLTNLTLTPLLPVIMAAAVGALVLGAVPVVGAVAVGLFDALARLVDWITGAVAALPHALLEPVYFPLPAALLAAGLLALWAVGMKGSNCEL